jgi:membrane-bound ClpP family serine protease
MYRLAGYSQIVGNRDPSGMHMNLLGLTILLLGISALSLVAPALWQGVALLLVVVLMSLDAHNPPPLG